MDGAPSRGTDADADAGRARLVGVDALRGVAALTVLLHHLPEVEGPLRWLRPVQAIGWAGVGLFLVLSGFSIHFRWAAGRPGDRFAPGRFWRRRFWRLYPTYLAAVVLTAALAVVVAGWSGLPQALPWKVGDGTAPLVVGLLVQVTLVGANVLASPYLAVNWSLALEIQLYAVYSLIATRMRAIGVGRLVLISLAVALVWRVGVELLTTSVPSAQFRPDGSASELSRLLYSQLPARWFEWMLGAYAAEAYFGRLRIPRPLRTVAVSVVALVVAAWLFRHQLGGASLGGNAFFVSDVLLDPLFGVGFLGVLLWSVGRADVVPGRRTLALLVPLAAVGVFSYSLYLTHGAFVALGAWALPASLGHLVTELALFGFALAGAYGFFLLVERRYLRPGPERVAISPRTRAPARSSSAA